MGKRATYRPITVRQASRHELLDGVIDAATDAIIGLGEMSLEDGQNSYSIVIMNSAAEQMLGNRSLILGQRLDHILCGNTNLIPKKSEISAALADQMATEKVMFDGSDEELWYRVSIQPFTHGAVVTLQMSPRLSALSCV